MEVADKKKNDSFLHAALIWSDWGNLLFLALNPIQGWLRFNPYIVFINGLVQNCSISIANAQEILQSCIEDTAVLHWIYCSFALSHR